MKIITLDTIPFSDLTACFNLSFSDYFVKFEVTDDYLRERWAAAGVDYSLCAGVLDNDKLVGFIVNGIKNWNGLKTAFNSGTGVTPSHRGNGLTIKMYNFLLPKLKAAGVESLLLEVIQQNTKAIHIYEKVGLKIHRSLNFYTVEIKNTPTQNINSEFYFKKMERPEWGIFQSFLDVQPAWDNSQTAIQHSISKYTFFGVFEKNKIESEQDELVAFAIVNHENNSLPQFGVHQNYRRRGLGKFLFLNLGAIFPILKINNVDDSSLPILKFLEEVGMQNSINQYEMVSYL